MKRNMRRFAALLLGLLVSIGLLAATVLAADVLSIPVTITAEGPLPDPAEVYTLRLTAGHSEYPMPEDQHGGSFDLQVTGPGNAFFPPICFDKVGVYTYSIQQLPGTNPRCSYDGKSYTVRITVANAEQGEYDISVALREGETREKSDEVTFHNVYRKAPTPPSPPKPFDPERPDVPPRPVTPPGSIVPTGVADHWALYLAGSVLLLLLSGWIIRLLRRKEDE